jgi:hypothetical protein
MPPSPLGRQMALAELGVRLPPFDTARGECMAAPLPRFREHGLEAVVLVFRADGSVSRRILVAVDDAGKVRRYSDVQAAGVRVDAETSDDGGPDVGIVVDPVARAYARTTSQEVLNDPALGPPSALARAVLAKCRSRLRG